MNMHKLGTVSPFPPLFDNTIKSNANKVLRETSYTLCVIKYKFSGTVLDKFGGTLLRGSVMVLLNENLQSLQYFDSLQIWSLQLNYFT